MAQSFSSSKATSQLIKAIGDNNRYAFSALILKIWIRSRRLHKDQWIQTNKLRSVSIRIYFVASVRYKYASFSKEKGVAFLILKARIHTTLATFLCQSTTATHLQFSSTGPSLFHLLILVLKGFKPAPHQCSKPEKRLFFLCSGKSE